MGVAWIAAEMIYFLAYSDPAASFALLSVFCRLILVVGFFSSISLRIPPSPQVVNGTMFDSRYSNNDRRLLSFSQQQHSPRLKPSAADALTFLMTKHLA
jgi:hypothetical protein